MPIQLRANTLKTIPSHLSNGNSDTAPSTGAFVLSFIAVALALVTGWLGGELVDRLGVGVDRGAHLDAPSSLSGKPATEQASPREIRRVA